MILTILSYVGIGITVYKLFQIAAELGEIKALLLRNGRLPAEPGTPASSDTIASLRALGADSESYADQLLRQVRGEAEPKWAGPVPIPHSAASTSEEWSTSSHSAEAIEDESEIEYEEEDVYEQDLAEQDIEPEELQALTPEVVAPRTYESKLESRTPQPPALRSSTLPPSIPLNEFYESTQRGDTEAPTSALNSIALKSVAVQSVPAAPIPANITPVQTSVASQVIPSQVSLEDPQVVEQGQQLSSLGSSVAADASRETISSVPTVSISSVAPRVHEVRLPAPPETHELHSRPPLVMQHHSESIATEELPTTIFLRSSDESSIHSDLPSFTPAKRSWDDGV